MCLSKNSKKILIVNPIPLFPIVMASQDRVVEMIRRLSKDHIVDVTTLVRTKKEIAESVKNLKDIANKFYPVLALNHNLLQRIILGLLFKLQYPIFSISKRYFYWGNTITTLRILKIIKENNYDIVQIEHWYQGRVIKKLDPKIYKVLSSHDLLYEKKKLELEKAYGSDIPFFRIRELKKYKKLEQEYYKLSDLVISISNIDRKKIESITPDKKHITIPIGKNIKATTVEKNSHNKTILFYGSMSGSQNIIAFNRLWKNIYPIIKKEIPESILLVVGANPPKFITELHNGYDVIVTGYVSNPTQYLKKAKVMIIPLETGGGFRGRVIDVLILGIPVVGTHNSLDCVEIINGKHGFVSDDDHEMASEAIKILLNSETADYMREKCLSLATERYSIESTYGKLSNFYLSL